jgi:CHAT domain-containing protein
MALRFRIRVAASLTVLAVWGFASSTAQLHAQSTDRAPTPGPSSVLRPEEIAADELLAGSQPREALAQLARADAAYRRAGDRLARARVALKRSRSHLVLGELAAAARAADEARAGAKSDPQLYIQAATLLARVDIDGSHFERAEEVLREAMPIVERAEDARLEANLFRAFAVLENRRGEQRKALEYYNRAATAADRSNDAPARVAARADMTEALLGLSRYDAALASSQEGFEIAERAGGKGLRARALFALAQANAHVWNLDRSAELWAATNEAYRAVGELRSAALALKQGVETWFALGDFDRAAADGAAAVDELRATGQLQYLAETTARLALSEVRRGRMEEARVWADRARADLPNAPVSRHLFVHNDLGIVEAELGELARARADFARVLEVAQRIGNIEYEWRAHWGFGRTALRDKPVEAIAPLERAIASVERLRQTIPEAGLRAAFMINRVGPYETLVEAHMATSSNPRDEGVRRAFEIAERARSRALADLLAEARAQMTDARLAAVREEETSFGLRFSAVQKRIAGATEPAARAAALEELQELERHYETLVVRIRRDNPSYAALAYPRALSLGEITSALARDEALVEFLMTDKQGFAWIVRRDSVRGYRVPGGKSLDPQIRLLTALLAARDDRAIEQLGAQLYATLLAPGEEALRGVRRITIVPDGVLQRLPFSLLRSNERWLIETHTVTLAPSATILQFLRQPRAARAPEPLLALAAPVADPGHAALFDRGVGDFRDLAHATEEVADARRIVGTGPDSARVGSEASESTLKGSDASRYRILHFAAHAIADEVVPRRSAILLASDGQDDGLLQVSEIANLSLNADLVVLAACRSHVGRLVRGEGLLSLSRAFMHAGARAVVATAWSVSDRETAWLMRRFYAALRDGAAPDEALRRAQLEALGSRGAHSAANVWAAFVVLGDAGSPILEASHRSRFLTRTFAASIAALAMAGGVVMTIRWRARRRSGSLHAEAGRR